jgi:hypothetical protein
LRLYINEKIKPPLFATISHCVFIIHVSYCMFRLYISHPQVYHVQKDWRTAHTIIRGYTCLLTLNFKIFTFYILYMRPVTVNINVFTTFILCLITCIGDHGSKYLYRHTSSWVRTTDPL